MIKISILTPQQKYKRGFNDFYPILKWEKEFKKQNIRFKFFKFHTQKGIIDCDILLIDTRYHEMILKGHYNIPLSNKYLNENFIIEFIKYAKRKCVKTVLIDNDDSGGSSSFNITPYVDLHLKKQIYKDKTKYQEFKEYNFMPWLPKNERVKEIKNKAKKYYILDSSEMFKLRLSWNIGLCDYRKFPLQKYYPIGTSALFNDNCKKLKYKNPSTGRKYLLSYRGSSNRFPSYDHQRNLVLSKLKNLELSNVIVGGKVSYNQYINEQMESKLSISPFGWGEICYRDFESFINGCLLLKPDMGHLDTFPDFFTKQTYVDFKWDSSDLISKIHSIKENYEDYICKIKNSQLLLKKYQEDSIFFVEHFKKNVLS